MDSPTKTNNPPHSSTNDPSSSFNNNNNHPYNNIPFVYNNSSDKLAIIMVGLPASGKSFTARNLSRYLRWIGVNTFIFSAALYRQKMIGTRINSDFFDASNEEHLIERTRVADVTLKDMVTWFQEADHPCNVAIMDASNTIKARRHIIKSSLEAIDVKVIFIECVYEREEILNEHLHCLHLLSPDYEHMMNEPEAAQSDYKKRIQFYRQNYEPVEDKDSTFIKLINGGERIVIMNNDNDNSIEGIGGGGGGYLQSKIIFFLMNLHFGHKKIFLKVFNGRSNEEKEKEETMGSFEVLVSNCKKFSSDSDGGYPESLEIWTFPEHELCEIVSKQSTSTSRVNSRVNSRRASILQTNILNNSNILSKYKCSVKIYPSLTPLNMANLEGLTHQQIAELYPEEAVKHLQFPYKHRYPRCESYADLSRRLETVMLESERIRSNILIIADISVIRCIYSFYIETSDPNVPDF